MKLFAAAFGLLLLPALPALRAQSPATPSFDVASVKPNKSGGMGTGIMFRPGGRVKAENATLKTLIRIAWDVQGFQISGGPAWIDSDRWDIEAKGGTGGDLGKESEEERKADLSARRQMIQALLIDRFKLTLHKESKESPIYALVVAKGGAKIKELPPEEKPPADADAKPDPKKEPRNSMRMGPGEINGSGIKLEFLADSLSNVVGRKVVDQTGLKGEYAFDLKWTPDPGAGPGFGPPPGGPGPGGPGGGPPPPDPNGPSLFTAIQEQLGLKLESQKGPVDLLVIDSVEKATEN